jgi:hypothetical protein
MEVEKGDCGRDTAYTEMCPGFPNCPPSQHSRKQQPPLGTGPTGDSECRCHCRHPGSACRRQCCTRLCNFGRSASTGECPYESGSESPILYNLLDSKPPRNRTRVKIPPIQISGAEPFRDRHGVGAGEEADVGCGFEYRTIKAGTQPHQRGILLKMTIAARLGYSEVIFRGRRMAGYETGEATREVEMSPWSAMLHCRYCPGCSSIPQA